jgi:hypothetical protein
MGLLHELLARPSASRHGLRKRSSPGTCLGSSGLLCASAGTPRAAFVIAGMWKFNVFNDVNVNKEKFIRLATDILQ